MTIAGAEVFRWDVPAFASIGRPDVQGSEKAGAAVARV